MLKNYVYIGCAQTQNYTYELKISKKQLADQILVTHTFYPYNDLS